MGQNEPKQNNTPGGNNQPPDLDEVIKQLKDKFKRIFSSGGSSEKKSGTTPPTGDSDSFGTPFFFLIGAVIFLLWALSGIFIVDPAERAVILRFGKYIETVGPGPHWIPRFIDSKKVVNVDRVSDYSYSGQMLTKDENLVSVALVVQYRIGDLENYLFNIADPMESLREATSSALRQVIGTNTLDAIITEGRESWAADVQKTLVDILNRYKGGIFVVNVSPQPARAPESVQDAFDDAIKAQEDEKRFKEQAYAYEARVVPVAAGHAKRIFEEAQAYAQQVVLQAQGEVAEFLALLPKYREAPFVISHRMYLDAMQQVLSSTSKILVDAKSNNLLYLPLEALMSGKKMPSSQSELTQTTDFNNHSSGASDREDSMRQTMRQGRDVA